MEADAEELLTLTPYPSLIVVKVKYGKQATSGVLMRLWSCLEPAMVA